MDINELLKEYEKLEIKNLDREQLESFRDIFFTNGLIEKSLEISEFIYNNNKNDEDAIVYYVNNLIHLGRDDDALIILFNSRKTPKTLFLEGIIYKQDMLLDVAKEKFLQAEKLVENDDDLKNAISIELSEIYSEIGNNNEALDINYKIFNENKNVQTFKNVLKNLVEMAKFEEAVQFYKHYGKDYHDAEITFSVAFAYNQLHELDKSKDLLLKTIAYNNEFSEAYLHLGFMSQGEKAIHYFEKYLELHGSSTNVYLQLTALYKQTEQYDKIRKMVKNVLETMGIDIDTLYISINALRQLYETEKIYNIYTQHSIIKEDSSLLALALLSLSEEEDFIDFVENEVKENHELLKDELYYYEILNNIYEVTNDKTIKNYISEIEVHKNIRPLYYEDLAINNYCSCGKNCRDENCNNDESCCCE